MLLFSFSLITSEYCSSSKVYRENCGRYTSIRGGWPAVTSLQRHVGATRALHTRRHKLESGYHPRALHAATFNHSLAPPPVPAVARHFRQFRRKALAPHGRASSLSAKCNANRSGGNERTILRTATPPYAIPTAVREVWPPCTGQRPL